ncbi:MAG: hypothetical protein ABSA84_01795 [Gammaproteobacteria bacterium]
MGIRHIGIEKISETEIIARYQFINEFSKNGIKDEENFGIIEINKKTGNCCLIKHLIDDENDELAFYAGRKLVSHWKDGEFPNVTCWAS